MPGSLEGCIHVTDKYYAASDLEREDITNNSYSEYVINAASHNDFIRTIKSIEEKLLKKNINQGSVEEAVVAISEIIQNAQEHSCNFSPDKEVHISFITTPKYIFAGVGNEGIPLNIGKAKELLDNYNPGSKSSRGRGFEMIRRTTDIIYIPEETKYSEIIMGKVLS